ncbi:MAG: phosphoribosylformylglycinamidine synthase subunit PurS [Alphaproteobacteria bacterium]|nr:phosphoribosylformylglycinamidine synthase subunit PurS [Alphaproteobacteria bacterium]
MKAKVHVTLKRAVLDPQGKAIAHALNALGFPEVTGARQGKVIELELADLPPGEADARLDAMCRALLANPVIEDYRIERGT